MANINTDALVPEFWAVSFDELDTGQYNFQEFVSRDVERQLQDYGDSVTVPLTPDFEDAEDWTPGDNIVATQVSQETAKVVLNKSKRKTISLTGKELSLPPYDLIQKYGVPLAKSILRSVNRDIYTEILKTGYIIDATAAGSFSEDTVIRARTVLSNNEVGPMNRRIATSPDDMGDMLSMDAFQHVDISGSRTAMEQGELSAKFGFTFFENNIIDMRGNAGEVQVRVALAAGAKAVETNGALTAMKEGDICRFQGETGTPLHTLIAYVRNAAGDVTGFQFSPAIRSAVAVNSRITFIPTRSLVAFVPSACAFAARSYKQLPVGVNNSTFIVRGLPVRISVWHDGKLGLNVQYDILYGSKMVKESRVVRIVRL